jgi:hypothetical protein
MFCQISVQGHLDGQWAHWFGGRTINLEDNGDTPLSGPVVRRGLTDLPNRHTVATP